MFEAFATFMIFLFMLLFLMNYIWLNTLSDKINLLERYIDVIAGIPRPKKEKQDG